jgi:hypothetical protein
MTFHPICENRRNLRTLRAIPISQNGGHISMHVIANRVVNPWFTIPRGE